MGMMTSTSLHPSQCWAQSPGFAGSLGNRILSGRRLPKATGLTEKQDTGEEGKNPPSSNCPLFLGCKPSSATGLGVGTEMMHSKGLLYPKAISASSASGMLCIPELPGKRLPEAGRRVHAEVSLKPGALGMLVAAAEGRLLF